MKFDWDPVKNESNFRKHGISFEEAVFVFTDCNALSIYDEGHSEYEDRWITIGRVPVSNIVVVIHTDRLKNQVDTIRIISARKATKNEISQYINFGR